MRKIHNMTIIFVTNNFASKHKASTGLNAYIYRVSKTLMELGHKVVIVAGGAERSKVFYMDGIEVHKIKKSFEPTELNLLKNITTLLYESYCLNREVEKLCKTRKIHIIQYASPYGLGIFYHSHVPAVLRLSWYAKIYFSTYTRFNKRQVDIFSWAERLQARKMTGIFGPGRVIAKEYGKDVKRKVTLIETPFYNEVVKENSELYNKKLAGKKYALFFGSLFVEKGVFVIGEILEEFLRQYPDYYMVFAGGNGIYENQTSIDILNQMAGKYSHRIIYLGAIKHEQLYPIIQNAEFIMLPSLMENFSNACMEAMYFGKIVIGTSGTTFEQLITSGKNGFLARPGDARSLKENIHKIMDLSAEKKKEMELEAQKRIEQLKPDIAVKKLIQYYNKMIKKYSMTSKRRK